jgi:hypothetical protein
MENLLNYFKPVNRLKDLLLKRKVTAKFLFIIMGIASTIWFLFRVIPKPQRATYPCMRAAAPIMSGFIIYIISLGGITLLFKKSISYIKHARYWSALIAGVIGIVVLVVFNIHNISNTFGNTKAFTKGILPDSPNSPVGEDNDIFPGRVIWSYNPASTRDACTNTISDAYFMASNTNQDTINKMANQAIKSIGGKSTVSEAWDAIFKNFNLRKTGTATGYAAGQKIFIKINNGQAGWAINFPDLSERSNSSSTGVSNAAMSNTSPQAVLAFLVQLIDSCGVAQSDIIIGEPMTHVYKSMYDIVHPIYPNVILIDKEDHTAYGRTTSAGWQSNAIKFSDKGKVMNSAITDNIMQEMYNASYMINIAALKAHARSGVTFCAKNHFGSSTHGNTYSADRLHSGSINANPDNDNLTNARSDYHMYRVLTDLMGHEKLGRNTVLFVVDGLWGGIEATDMPVKWQIAPFNNDWPSSLFVSQDEIALESVCLDFLRAEADVNTDFNNRPFFPAVDDFLHQGASKANWPDSIKGFGTYANKWYTFAGYDPEGDGSLMPSSLGIHEHWNDLAHKQYTRNLFTNGTGIELVSFPKSLVAYDNGTAFNLNFTITNNTVPVEGAIIIVNGSNYITDADGKVTIGDFTNTTGLTFTIHKKGYNTISDTVDISGNTDVSEDFAGATPPEGITDITSSNILFSAYPNPMSTECEISYTLNSSANVSLMITSLNGKAVKQLQYGQVSEGNYTEKFTSENLSSGIYICVLKAQFDNRTEIKTLKLEVK